jgi:hypothetical protein
MERPTLEEFSKIERSKYNTGNQKHHPDIHYTGSSPSCPNCDESLESLEQLYARIYPTAITEEGNEIEAEVIEPVQETLPILNKPEKKKKGSLFPESLIPLRKAQEKRKKRLQKTLVEVENAEALKPMHLNDKHVLCLPSCEFVRSLSIIQCLIEIELKLGKKIYEQYDVIAATGDSSIIAVSCALGIDLESLKDFWVKDWKNAYDANLLDKAVRRVQSLNPLGTPRKGFSSEKAKKILSSFFKVGDKESIQKTFHDLKTEVYLPALFSRRKETFAYTKATSEELPLCDALNDLCLNPLYFDTKETVKNVSGIPLPIRDPELFITQNNKDVILTKIEVPFIHSDNGSMNHATDKELAPVLKETYDFILKIITEEVKPLKKIKYSCKSISSKIKKNSINEDFMFAAIEAGKGIEPVQV